MIHTKVIRRPRRPDPTRIQPLPQPNQQIHTPLRPTNLRILGRQHIHLRQQPGPRQHPRRRRPAPTRGGVFAVAVGDVDGLADVEVVPVGVDEVAVGLVFPVLAGGESGWVELGWRRVDGVELCLGLLLLFAGRGVGPGDEPVNLGYAQLVGLALVDGDFHRAVGVFGGQPVAVGVLRFDGDGGADVEVVGGAVFALPGSFLGAVLPGLADGVGVDGAGGGAEPGVKPGHGRGKRHVECAPSAFRFLLQERLHVLVGAVLVAFHLGLVLPVHVAHVGVPDPDAGLSSIGQQQDLPAGFHPTVEGAVGAEHLGQGSAVELAEGPVLLLPGEIRYGVALAASGQRF